MHEIPASLPPKPVSTTNTRGIFSSSQEVVKGRLWPLIEETLSLGEDSYRPQGSFRAIVLGQILVSTDSEEDARILRHPRYGPHMKGGHGWDTFARTCFGWENLIMTEGPKHAKLSRALGPLFKEKIVREQYFRDLKAVTQTTVENWAKEKKGVSLLKVALEHSCRSVTTCFLGREAARSTEIISAVQNLLGIFWDNAQIKPLATLYFVSRKLFNRCCDPDGYWHSHDVLEEAIENARQSAPKESFIGQLLDEKFTSQELIDNMKMLYFAGTETTGSLITTVLGYLAALPDQQKKLRNELHETSIYSLDDLDYDTIQNKLPRLHAFLLESLRLVPPLPAQVREVQAEEGSYAYFIDHYHRLRDVKLVGKNPTEFDPERFLKNPDLKKEVQKTFGGGLTPCPGKNFAVTETLLLSAAIILQGPLELTAGNPNEVIMEAGAHLSSELTIRLGLKED